MIQILLGLTHHHNFQLDQLVADHTRLGSLSLPDSVKILGSHGFDIGDFMTEFLTSLGGGGSGFFNDITRFTLGACMAMFMVYYATSRRHCGYYKAEREHYLLTGFYFSLARNIFMLAVKLGIYITSVIEFETIYGGVHHVVQTSVVVWAETLAPPIEHLLYFMETAYISMAFAVYLSKTFHYKENFIRGIWILGGLAYAYSALERFLIVTPYSDNYNLVSFGSAGVSDYMWHLLSFGSLIYPILVVLQLPKDWLVRLVLYVFAGLSFYHLGKVLDLLTLEIYEKSFFAPLRHCIGLAIMPVLFWLYIRENELRIEEEINATRTLAEQLDTFVRGTVHELRSPLAGVEGTLDVLLSKYNKVQLTDQRVKSLNIACPRKRLFCDIVEPAFIRMHDGVSHLSDILETMADFGQNSDQTIVKPHNIALMVRRAMKVVKFRQDIKRLPKGTMRLQVDEGFPSAVMVNLSPVRFRQVIDNLITNAVFALVEADPPMTQLDIILGWSDPGKRVYISVIDNGCGMSAQDLDHCFDKNYTSKGSRGNGLGLYFTKKYITDVGGTIIGESEIGHGTRMTLTYPVADREEDVPSIPAATVNCNMINLKVIEDHS